MDEPKKSNPCHKKNGHSQNVSDILQSETPLICKRKKKKSVSQKKLSSTFSFVLNRCFPKYSTNLSEKNNISEKFSGAQATSLGPK